MRSCKNCGNPLLGKTLSKICGYLPATVEDIHRNTEISKLTIRTYLSVLTKFDVVYKNGKYGHAKYFKNKDIILLEQKGKTKRFIRCPKCDITVLNKAEQNIMASLPATYKEICEKTGESRSNVSMIASRLVKEGIIKKIKSYTRLECLGCKEK